MKKTILAMSIVMAVSNVQAFDTIVGVTDNSGSMTEERDFNWQFVTGIDTFLPDPINFGLVFNQPLIYDSATDTYSYGTIAPTNFNNSLYTSSSSDYRNSVVSGPETTGDFGNALNYATSTYALQQGGVYFMLSDAGKSEATVSELNNALSNVQHGGSQLLALLNVHMALSTGESVLAATYMSSGNVNVYFRDQTGKVVSKEVSSTDISYQSLDSFGGTYSSGSILPTSGMTGVTLADITMANTNDDQSAESLAVALGLVLTGEYIDFNICVGCASEEEFVNQVVKQTAEKASTQTRIISTTISRRIQRSIGASSGYAVSSAVSISTSGMNAGDDVSQGMTAWVSPVYSQLDSNQTGSAYSGNLKSLQVGLDKKINASTVVGAAATLEKSDTDYTVSGNKSDSSGGSVIAYLGHAFTDTILLDAFVGYGHFNNSVLMTTGSGDYNSKRFIAGTNITKMIESDNSNLKLTAGILHSSERADSYSMSTGVAISSHTTKVTQGIVSAEISSVVDNYMPYFTIGYIRDLNNSEKDEEGGLTFGGGVNYQKDQNMAFNLDFLIDTGRSTETSKTVSASMRYSF